MSDFLWSGVLLLALVLFWAIGAYNRLVRLRAAVGAAFGALDPLLGERLAWVQGAPAHDPARAEAWARLGAAAEQWAVALAPVRAQPANGPAVLSLAQAQAALEAAWAAAAPADAAHALHAQWDRLRHQELPLLAANNEAVRVYNAARAQFPAAVMARLGGFRPAQALALAEGARA